MISVYFFSKLPVLKLMLVSESQPGLSLVIHPYYHKHSTIGNYFSRYLRQKENSCIASAEPKVVKCNKHSSLSVALQTNLFGS